MTAHTIDEVRSGHRPWSTTAADATGARSATPALELRRVVKEYPGQPPVRALDDVSLRIDGRTYEILSGDALTGDRLIELAE